ncbi:hypothetical protein [Streptomyces olivochromogenes]|uniref:hypothetical protein n=1 Tax=Streptomyces olivochromogenes TaxID=1963 RepID=UPI001F3C99F2|nr:hypothetical protein [Streptomyces olivochromogenes]MCF3134184.1 hypothetical protein [Streptomyces olivochromogenes]
MKKRLRRLQLAAATLAVAVAASACGPAGGGDASAKPTAAGAERTAGTPSTAKTSARPPATAPPSRAPKPAPAKTAAAPRTRAPWPHVTFARLTFEIPPGWTLMTYGSDACVQPVHQAGLPTMFGCAGIAIQSGSIAGHELQPYEARQPGGWYAATDVQPCPVDPTLADGSFNGISSGTSSPPVESGLRPVGNHKAAYDRWTAACANGHRFSPRAWHLPVSRVLFLDYTGHVETARVLESVRFPD